MKRYVFLAMMFSFFSVLWGQNPDSEEGILLAVDGAVGNEEYEKALELIARGKELFPGSSLFPARAGELYMEKRLFNLALEEFREAEALNPSPSIRYQLSRLHGFLDNNRESAAYLEGLLEDPQYGQEALADLGWIYFKLHRLRDGETLLLEALEKGFNRTLAHTIGTIYSGMYEYDKSREYYTKSLENALAGSDNYFASVAYYNMALLEISFYRYEEALQYTALSLNQVNRPSGHMARGELLQLTLDFDGALEEFTEAHNLSDESPLALKDMADLYREFGYLDKALELIRKVRQIGDKSWMYYYGLNRMEWDRDITEILMEIFEGKRNESAVLLKRGLKEHLRSLLDRMRYGWQFRYHRGRFRKLCRRLGRIQLDENNSLHGWILMAEGARDYRRTALFYWRAARDFETVLAARADALYKLRLGREMKDPEILIQGYHELIVPWENSLRAEALAESILLKRRGVIRRPEKLELTRLINELYRLNRGALRQKGITLPLIIDNRGDNRRKIARLLRRLHRKGDAENPSLCYHLTLIAREGASSSWYLESPDGIILREGRRDTPALDREGTVMLIREVEDNLYGAGE